MPYRLFAQTSGSQPDASCQVRSASWAGAGDRPCRRRAHLIQRRSRHVFAQIDVGITGLEYCQSFRVDRADSRGGALGQSYPGRANPHGNL